jgi:hypothetical protein
MTANERPRRQRDWRRRISRGGATAVGRPVALFEEDRKAGFECEDLVEVCGADMFEFLGDQRGDRSVVRLSD